jgi:O-antigen/teichoic acid export membrane protein
MTGSVIGQLIGFALSPIISRLFTPADFGVFGSYLAVTTVIAAGVTLDYSQAVMLPHKKEDAGQVFLLSCFSGLTVTALCLVAWLIFPGWLKSFLKINSSWIMVLMILDVLAAGLNASFQAWCVRVKAFRETSFSQIVRGLSSNGLQVGLGFARVGGIGLISASVLADFIASLNLMRVLRGELQTFLRAAKWSRLKQLALEYRDFPSFSATQNIINALSNSLPVICLTHFYGVAVAGAYAFGLKLLNAPVGLVTSALRQVLFQKAGEMQHQGRSIWGLYLKTTAGLFSIGVIPAAVLSAYAPQLFAWIFGARWRTAGEFARYLVLWLLFAFCNLPAVLFARLIRIQRALFVYNSVVLGVRALALVIGGLFLTALQSIALFSLLGAIMNLFLILFVGRAVMMREGEFGQLQLRDVFGGSPSE